MAALERSKNEALSATSLPAPLTMTRTDEPRASFLFSFWLRKRPVPSILTMGLEWGQGSGRKRRETLECLGVKALTKHRLHFCHFPPPTPQI